MPIMYQCKAMGCNKLVENRGTYCEVHKHMETKKPFEGAIRSNEGKYNSAKWRKVVEGVLRRDNYCCSKCGSIEKLAVHHTIEGKLSEELFYNPNICLTLCSSCHLALHNKNRQPPGYR